jgi:hypothetical protein
LQPGDTWRQVLLLLLLPMLAAKMTCSSWRRLQSP